MKKTKKLKKKSSPSRLSTSRLGMSRSAIMYNEKYVIRDIQDLFKRCGGSTNIASKLNLHAFTVENWRRCGVPLKYWRFFLMEYGVLAAELLDIWEDCKKNKTGK